MGKAKTTGKSSDYDAMLQKRDRMIESKKAYKENGTKGALKKSKLEYDQSIYNYKKNANKVNKFLGKQEQYKIGLLSPKAKDTGKKAAIAALAVIGTIGVSYAGLNMLYENTPHIYNIDTGYKVHTYVQRGSHGPSVQVAPLKILKNR